MYNIISPKIFIIILLTSNYILSTEDTNIYNITKLEEFSIIKPTWNPKEKYIYFLSLEKYSLNDENIIQIVSEDTFLITNLTIYELSEKIIINNKTITSEIDLKKDSIIKRNVKFRLKPKRFYNEILVKKNKENQKYFVMLIDPHLVSKNETDFELIISKKISTVSIKKSDIAEGYYFSQKYDMHPRIENFIKFNFINISLKNHNLILFVHDQGVSSFYLGDLAGKQKRTTSFLVYEKKKLWNENFVIYLSLLGQANETVFEMKLDDHDIIYTYSNTRKLVHHYIEKINCTNDFYIFESYFDADDRIKTESYNLDVTPIYGDYELFHYDVFAKYIKNISNLFKQGNNDIQKIEGITPLNSDLSGFKLVCKTPSLIGIKYIGQNINLNISEGKEIICTMEKKKYIHNFIFLKDANKEYNFYIGFYKLPNETSNYRANYHSLKNFDPNKYYGSYQVLSSKLNDTEYFNKLYYGKDRDYIEYDIESQNNGINLKLFLISNQYYKNIVEGVTKLNPGEKAIAFKIRNDIIFDYFIFKAYTNNLLNYLSMNYEIKIVPKKYIEKDKVMMGMNPYSNYANREINMKLSNPYNKFNSRIKSDEYVYLLAEFLLKDEYYPIYIDIRYYYNDKIISIAETKPEILLDKKEYKIYGNKDNDNINNILININKCNNMSNYTIKTYYENDNNLISEENITNQRTFLFHKNIFNNTKITIKGNNINNTYNNLFQQESYYKNGDIYLNYFPLKNSLNDLIQITKDFSISYEDIDNKEILFKWKPYISSSKLNQEFPVNYSLYILPQDSLINSICQMSLIPPNVSLIDKSDYKLNLEKGKYKINIVASVVNEDFPLITSYDLLYFEVSNRINIKLILILSIPCLILVVVIVILISYCKLKNKKDEIDNLREERKSKLLSALGFNEIGEKEGIIFDRDDDVDSNKIKDDEDCLKNIENNNNDFSVSSE